MRAHRRSRCTHDLRYETLDRHPIREVLMSAKKLSLIVLSAAALAAAVVRAQEPAPGTEPVVVIRAGTLIDGRSDQPRRNQVIVVRGHRIESVGDAAGARTPAGARVIDLSSATV